MLLRTEGCGPYIQRPRSLQRGPKFKTKTKKEETQKNKNNSIQNKREAAVKFDETIEGVIRAKKMARKKMFSFKMTQQQRQKDPKVIALNYAMSLPPS